jgi:hypothetical protein
VVQLDGHLFCIQAHAGSSPAISTNQSRFSVAADALRLGRRRRWFESSRRDQYPCGAVDSALEYESRGREFESLQGCQIQRGQPEWTHTTRMSSSRHGVDPINGTLAQHGRATDCLSAGHRFDSGTSRHCLSSWSGDSACLKNKRALIETGERHQLMGCNLKVESSPLTRVVLVRVQTPLPIEAQDIALQRTATSRIVRDPHSEDFELPPDTFVVSEVGFDGGRWVHWHPSPPKIHLNNGDLSVVTAHRTVNAKVSVWFRRSPHSKNHLVRNSTG